MEGNLQSVLKVARMEVTQNRGLTLRPIDVLSGSDDKTPEDLGLSSSLSIHLHVREDSWNISPGGPLVPSPLLSSRKVNLQNDPLIVVLITMSGANEPGPR